MRIARWMFLLMLIMGPLASAGCSVKVDGGTSLDLVAERSGTGVTADTMHTTLGYRVRLDRLYLAIHAIQLVSPSSRASLPSAIRRLTGLLLPSEACAHTPGTPTRLGVPSVLALNAAPGTQWSLGSLAPPPETYAGLRVILAPPDDDAQYLPSDVDMIDHTLHVDGMAYLGTDSVAIALAIPIHDSVEVSLSRGNGSALPLLARKQYEALLQWDPAVWFDRVDFLHSSAAAWEDSIRIALPRSVSIELRSKAAGVQAITAPPFTTYSGER